MFVNRSGIIPPRFLSKLNFVRPLYGTSDLKSYREKVCVNFKLYL